MEFGNHERSWIKCALKYNPFIYLWNRYCANRCNTHFPCAAVEIFHPNIQGPPLGGSSRVSVPFPPLASLPEIRATCPWGAVPPQTALCGPTHAPPQAASCLLLALCGAVGWLFPLRPWAGLWAAGAVFALRGVWGKGGPHCPPSLQSRAGGRGCAACPALRGGGHAAHPPGALRLGGGTPRCASGAPGL